MYRLSPLTYRLGKPFVHVDTYGMVNLVAGRRVVPELIQDDLPPEAVAAEAVGFLTDTERTASHARGIARGEVEARRRRRQPPRGGSGVARCRARP